MTIRTAAAFALVVAGFAILANLLLPADAPAAVAEAPAVVAVETPAPAVDPLLAALAPSTDLAPEQAARLLDAADRVCEGLTAGVPVAIMSTDLMHDLSLTGEEARDLVNTAALIHCAR